MNKRIKEQNAALALCVRLRRAGALNVDGCSYSKSFGSFRRAMREAGIKGFSPSVVRIAFDLCGILDCGYEVAS